jgi:hypothetical protein
VHPERLTATERAEEHDSSALREDATPSAQAVAHSQVGERSPLAGRPGRRLPQRRRDEAREVASIYRALRKGREDRKDEPGAADFYYGEMEMRRASSRGVEKVLLAIFWAISGYGLRAWRSMTSLLTVIFAAALIITVGGFNPPQPQQPQIVPVGMAGIPEARWVGADGKISTKPPQPKKQAVGERFTSALLYSAESATVVFRGPEQTTVSTVGRACQIALRILGPALFALTVFALRSRVKR